MARTDAILASSSASSLYLCGTWLSSRPSNLSSRRRTALQYASIFGSWQLDSFITRSMTSYESPRTSRRLMPSSMAMRRPLRSASYSTMLLDAGKCKRIT